VLVSFFTFGCKVNQYESQAVRECFAAAGYDTALESSKADIFVINSCTVTSGGDQGVRNQLRRIRRENPDAVVVLMGCLPQASPEAADRLSEADILLGTQNRSHTVALVEEFLQNHRPLREILPYKPGAVFEALHATSYPEHTRAFLKIEDGCDRYCSYCIIPYARGPVRSMPLEDIVAQTKAFAQSGCREIVLSGINLSSYGKGSKLNLADAVDAACSVDGIERVRLGSLEPDLLTEEDLHRFSLQKKFCPQFHLALQSGCDRTLAAMRRHYDTAQFRRVAALCREIFPDCSLTTDVMVGFAGETEEDFCTSMDFVRDIGFLKVHVFPYSRRRGTRAADYPQQIARSEKQSRSRRMIAAASEGRKDFLRAQIGRTCTLLTEQPQDGGYIGYTENYTPVFLAEDTGSNQLIPVLITGVDPVRDRCIAQRIR